MGHIETLPSGRYRAIAWNAKKQRKEVVRDSRSRSGTWEVYLEAEAALERREGEIDGIYEAAGVPVIRQHHQPATESSTFAEYAEHWAAGRSGERATRSLHGYLIRTLNRRFANRRIDEITTADVNAYFRDCHDAGYKAGSREQLLIRLRHIMRAAVREGVRTTDPTTEVVITKPRRHQVRILTDQELLLAVLYLPNWFWPAALLAYDSGLRAAELAGLRWFRLTLDGNDPAVYVCDVLESDGTLRDYPKGKNPESVALTPRTVTALRQLRARHPSGKPMDYVFRSPHTDRPIRPARFAYIWRAARSKAGLEEPPVAFHDLRHACATNLARAGAPAPVIQATLRHANLTTSQIYIDDISLSEQRHWMGRVGQAPASVRPLHAAASPVDDERHDTEYAG